MCNSSELDDKAQPHAHIGHTGVYGACMCNFWNSLRILSASCSSKNTVNILFIFIHVMKYIKTCYKIYQKIAIKNHLESTATTILL